MTTFTKKIIKSLLQNLDYIKKCVFSSARPECFCKAKMYRRVKRKINYNKFFYVAPFDTFYYVSLRKTLRASGGRDKRYIIFLYCFMTFNLTYSFSHDSAIYAAQQGNWQEAHVALNNILIDNPDNADVLYDAGIAAHHLNNFGQAATCFSRAADCAANDDLRFRSHFSAGNACVNGKDLKCALEHYDKALAIQPDNEQVRHNRDRVKQMLQDNEKEKQQKDKDEKKENKKQEEQKKDEQQKDDKDKQDGNEQDQQQSGDQQQGNDQSQNSGNEQNQQDSDQQNGQDGNDRQNNPSRDGSNQQSQEKQSNGAERGEKKDTKRENHGDKKEQQHKNPTNDHQRNGNQELDKKTDHQKEGSDKNQGNQHAQAPEKQKESNDKHNVASGTGQEQDKDDDKYDQMMINDPWLLQVLNDQEQKDKAINKQLMEAKIRQQGGKNGQNCW